MFYAASARKTPCAMQGAKMSLEVCVPAQPYRIVLTVEPSGGGDAHLRRLRVRYCNGTLDLGSYAISRASQRRKAF